MHVVKFDALGKAVTPEITGVQGLRTPWKDWIPAFTGMTK